MQRFDRNCVLLSGVLHGSACRLVRALLGDTAVVERKLGHGNPLVILGIRVTLSEAGFTCWHDDDKAPKWKTELRLGYPHIGQFLAVLLNAVCDAGSPGC